MARRLTEAQKKKKYLQARAVNPYTALQVAKLTPVEVESWRASGFLTPVEETACDRQFDDRMFAAMVEQGIDGVEVPEMAYGKPVPNPDGTPRMKRIRDTQALRMLAERRFVAQQKQAQDAIADAIPAMYRVTFDARDLTPLQFATIKKIVQDVEDRRVKRLLAQVDGLDTSISKSIGNDG